MVVQILDNLWQVGGPGLTHASDAAAYLIRFGTGATLVDAGTGRAHGRLAENIAQSLGSTARLEYLLLTHCHFDHAGGGHAVRREFGCRIAAHELDAVYLDLGDARVTAAVWYGSDFDPLTVDIRLQGSEATLAVGDGAVTMIHCPGHSPGSVVYTAEMDNRLILFGQDLQGPLHSDWLSDEEQYLESLARIEKLDADLLLEGHFGVFETKAEVRDFIESCITPRPQPCRC